ncbi:MAG: hypothetical protein KDK41_03845 [Leptospiraceae bacterium]|nr:hypothetical protein [Leptospiraceae bacterium]
MTLKNPFDKNLPGRIKIGVWASLVSAVMLIGIAVFWVVHPAAAQGSFSITPDTDAAIRFSKITAIFKAVGDLLSPIFVMLAIGYRQFRLAGIFHISTLVLAIAVDMLTWGIYVPNAKPLDVLQHIPFAIPILIAAYCFLTYKSEEI